MTPEEIKQRVDTIDKQIIALLEEREKLELSTYITNFSGTTYVITKLSPNLVVPNLQVFYEEQQTDGHVERRTWPFQNTTG